jgi:hypothetical protein
MMAGIAFATVNALMEELIWRRHTVRGRISVPAWPHCNITAGGVFRSRAHPRNPAGHYRHTARGCLGVSSPGTFASVRTDCFYLCSATSPQMQQYSA